MPFIVLIIDEVSDLMIVDARYYEDIFVSLFEKSASVGIHIYIGTSRPSVNVITGHMKASNDTRIAFRTSTSVDSHTLIGGAGAEQLNGAGDMLFRSREYTRPIRLQAPYVSMHEQKRAIEYIKS